MFLLAAVSINLLVEWALAWRHTRHVQTHRSAVPPPFANSIDLAAHQKAADYTVARSRFGMVSDGVGALLLLGWTLGGGLEALDQAWRSQEWGALHTGVAVMLSVSVISMVLGLPLTLYRTFYLEARFGFNKTTPALFAGDMLKGLGVTGLLMVPLAYAVLGLMHRVPFWWIWVWALWSGFTVLMMWAYPALIAPLFNTFRPLQDETLAGRVQALLDRCGFASRGVFVMDGSRRSSHGNAYFTGFGRNKRVVFFDTLLQTLQAPEVEAVLAHELGHYQLKHVTKRLVLGLVGSALALATLHWLMQQPALYQAFGVSTPSPHAALLLLMFVGPVLTFFTTPVGAWYSRRHEFEADRFAARYADARQLAVALTKLYRDNANTLTPDPWHSKFYDSHPPALVRISALQGLTPPGPAGIPQSV